MGKSAFRLVLARSQLVLPKGDQPPYVRSKLSIQTSPVLKRHQACVAKAFENKTFTDRADVRRALTEASKACKGRR